jgi:hypothetical protein
MTKSKCTCKHRNALAHVRNSAYPHEPGCYYVEVLKQEAKASEDRRIAQALYKHYRRAGKEA